MRRDRTGEPTEDDEQPPATTRDQAIAHIRTILQERPALGLVDEGCSAATRGGGGPVVDALGDVTEGYGIRWSAADLDERGPRSRRGHGSAGGGS